MPSRCATRRFGLQNSPEASTSTTAVCTAIDTSSPPPTSRALALRAAHVLEEVPRAALVDDVEERADDDGEGHQHEIALHQRRRKIGYPRKGIAREHQEILQTWD